MSTPDVAPEEKVQGPELVEEFLYLVTPKDNPLYKELAQFRKGAFWFFGWGEPEPKEKFSEWQELVVSLKPQNG